MQTQLLSINFDDCKTLYICNPWWWIIFWDARSWCGPDDFSYNARSADVGMFFNTFPANATVQNRLIGASLWSRRIFNRPFVSDNNRIAIISSRARTKFENNSRGHLFTKSSHRRYVRKSFESQKNRDETRFHMHANGRLVCSHRMHGIEQ